MSVKDEIDHMILDHPRRVRALMLSPRYWRAFCREVGAEADEACLHYRGYAAGRADAPVVLVLESWDA